MIIEYPHTELIFTNKGKIKKSSIYCKPRITIKCDNCNKIFKEKETVFVKRFNIINLEYCGKCSRPLMCKLNSVKSNYDENGNPRENSGRFSKEKWNNLSEDELNKRIIHNKKIAHDYHKFLNDNPDKKMEHYKKVSKHSTIGYISKEQR